MSKKHFVQAVIARSLPTTDKREAALAYAEELWSWLTGKGYGDTLKGINDKPHTPKTGVDYYRKLSPWMKTQFDRFWVAFNYKQGKQGAAMRWWQMGEMSREDCDKIIAAAELAARERKNLPEGRTPIMAQGWLNEMRFLDGEPTSLELNRQVDDRRASELAKLRGDLAHAKRMADLSDRAGVQFWQNEIDKITEKMRALRDGVIHD